MKTLEYSKKAKQFSILNYGMFKNDVFGAEKRDGEKVNEIRIILLHIY